MKWITFFSQTGSEIVNIVRSIGTKPSLIVTNNIDEVNWQYHPGIRELNVPILQAKHNILMNYFDKQTLYPKNDTLITLHGYLRIIPEKMCTEYQMYNGHPAFIRQYPELKGKDPQVRTWENKDKYPIIGSVIHKVTPVVDDGELVKEVSINNDCVSLDDTFNKLKQTSLQCWESFLKEYFNEDRSNWSTVSR